MVKGKRGNVVHLPVPARGSASAKVANTEVQTIIESGTGVDINLNKHFYYARLIEDIVETQALSSLRKFYTDDAGYALAKQKDTDLFTAAQTLQGGNGTAAWNKAVIAGDGTTLFVDASGNANATAVTDAGIRRVLQTLDDSDFPMTDRTLVVPPVGRRIIMGIARYTEQAFVGEEGKSNVIRNGKIADVYGVSVHVSSNCPTPSAATTARIGLLFHRDALACADVLGPRVQAQYKAQHLGTLLIADTIYGVGEIYDAGGVALAMPGA